MFGFNDEWLYVYLFESLLTWNGDDQWKLVLAPKKGNANSQIQVYRIRDTDSGPRPESQSFALSYLELSQFRVRVCRIKDKKQLNMLIEATHLREDSIRPDKMWILQVLSKLKRDHDDKSSGNAFRKPPPDIDSIETYVNDFSRTVGDAWENLETREEREKRHLGESQHDWDRRKRKRINQAGVPTFDVATAKNKTIPLEEWWFND